MNIGIVTTWFERGAAYVSKQFEEVLENKHNVFIYARGGESYAKGDEKWDRDNVTWGVRINSPFVATVIQKSDFIRWLKTNQIELVIFNEQHWFQPILWCKQLAIKTIAYIDYYTEKTIPLFNIYDAVICNTRRHLQAFCKHPLACYVPWGTDVDTFLPKNNGLVNEDVVTFFHSAGLSGERKGTDLFIKALAKLNRCKFRALIHTQNDLRPQFPELAETIEWLVKDGKLTIITKTVTAPGLYHLGDVYVYPSRLEGIGLTIAESISCGLACIVPDNGPMNEFVNEAYGKTVEIDKFYSRADGYYWPKCECSIDGLADAMEFYIDHPDIVIQQKQKSREYALRHLSHKKNFQRILQLVEETKIATIEPTLIDRINAYDNWGLKRLQKYFLLFRLYKFL